MIRLAKCPVCKQEQYGYEWTTTKSGKKWLKNSEGTWHNCPANQKQEVKKGEPYTKLVTSDFEFCDMCDTFIFKKETLKKYPKLGGKNMEEHKKMFHPNDEILDDIDFMVITEKEREKIRQARNQPKRKEKYYLLGKRLIA